MSRSETNVQGIEDIEKISAKNLPLNMVALKRDDYNRLKQSAETLVVMHDSAFDAVSENETLKNRISELKSQKDDLIHERDGLVNSLEKVNNSFERFYDSVADERALLERNRRLADENETIGNYVHELTDEIKALKEQNAKLSEDNENLTKAVEETTAELTTLQKLHKELQDKWDKVMKFIQELSLKEQWEKYIAAPIRKAIAKL